jgi:signal transduction histidine kinase
VLKTNSQSVSSRSLWDYTLKTKPVNPGEHTRTIQQGPEQQSLLVVSNGYIKQGNQFTISVAEDLASIKYNINQFQYWFAALAFSLLLVLLILQVVLLRSSLKPLAKIQSELKSLEQGQLDKLSTHAPNELRPLINEVNHLLSIMEQRLKRSRDASSDLAHAIKKPLTVIQQLAANSTLSEETRSVLTQQTGDIYQITDRILKRARLAGHSHGGVLFSFSEDLPALIKTLDMMYADKAPTLTCKIQQELTCPIDREDMLELLGNIMDNAYKWSRHHVNLTIDSNVSLHIVVEDDGPGADPEKINSLAKRGVRLDEKIQGHGFGLAIAADIVAHYAGEISFSLSTELGGFKADVILPLELNHI